MLACVCCVIDMAIYGFDFVKRFVLIMCFRFPFLLFVLVFWCVEKLFARVGFNLIAQCFGCIVCPGQECCVLVFAMFVGVSRSCDYFDSWWSCLISFVL